MNICNSLISFTSSVLSVISYALCGRAKKAAPSKVSTAAELAIQNAQRVLAAPPLVRGGASSSPVKEVIEGKSPPAFEKGSNSSVATSWKGLTAGSLFTYQGVKYRVGKTRGDGACALHAVLGQKGASGLYSFLGEVDSGNVARRLYVQALQDSLPNAALRDYLAFRLDELTTNGLPKTAENTLFSSQIPALLKELKGKKDRFIAAKDAYAKQGCSSDMAEKFHPSILEGLYKAYADTKEVEAAYLNSCLDSCYFFSDQEIGMMAKLFNMQITLFGETTGNKPTIYNPSGKEKVSIYFSHNHYSRLEIV